MDDLISILLAVGFILLSLFSDRKKKRAKKERKIAPVQPRTTPKRAGVTPPEKQFPLPIEDPLSEVTPALKIEPKPQRSITIDYLPPQAKQVKEPKKSHKQAIITESAEERTEKDWAAEFDLERAIIESEILQPKYKSY